MTNNPLQTLLMLLEQLERERDHAQSSEQQARQALDAARAPGDQLAQYQNEYADRWRLQSQQGQTVGVVHCHQNFMQQLQRAVDFQQERIDGARRHADQARAALLALQLRVASVRKLIERRQHEAAQAAHRIEQKTTDEQAARSARFAVTGITQFGPPSDFMAA